MNRRTFLKSGLLACGLTMVGTSAYTFESSRLEISRYRLSFPDMNQKMRIVAISDVHAPCLYSSIIDIVEIVNRESPDIFCLVGDIIDEKGNEVLVGMFGGIKARFAKLAVLGNWEYAGGIDLVKLKKEYAQAGISLLINQNIELGGLKIAGLDDFVYSSPDYQVLKRVPTASRPVLVLSHCPESFELLSAISPHPVIVISGHTHGGQITPFGVVLSTPCGSGPYVQGLYKKGIHSMYVMRGIGTSGVPLRIGARPEVLVLDIENSENSTRSKS